MAYMLRQRIVKTGALDDDATWRYKLPSIGKYTAFELEIEAGRYATRTGGTVCHTLHNVISKLELVAGGSRALFSLPGTQADAVNYWAFKRPTARRYRQTAASSHNAINLFLLGGRSLYDVKYGFDFARLPESYLEYTYNHHEDTEDYFAADSHYVTLYGWRWMDPGSPSFLAYLRNRQLAAWTTTGGDVIKNVEIPIGYPVRAIGVQSKTRAYGMWNTSKYLELKVNNGEYSPVTILSPWQWLMQETATYNLHNIVGGIEYLDGIEQMDIPYWFASYENVLAAPYGDTGAGQVDTHFLTLPARLRAYASGLTDVAFVSRGWGFQKCLRIGFDVREDESDLLRTSGMGALDLEVTEYAASRDLAVFVQDIVPY